MRVRDLLKTFRSSSFIKNQRRWITAGVALTLAVSSLGIGILPLHPKASAAGLALCGNPGPAPTIQHVVVVMLENQSYKQVVGNTNSPYQNSLTSQCSSATSMFGATHTSAANYLALSAGEFPASAPPGCGSVSSCRDASDNLYHQMDVAGLSWRNYQESMPTACAQTSSQPLYKIGHNSALFYSDIPLSECQAKDLPVSDLTTQAGVFWDDLQNQTLPSLSWVTPNLLNDGSGGQAAADAWTQKFITNLQQSNSYQAGNTLVLITYDEGTGSDEATGEDCTNKSLDLPITNNTSYRQDSCHIPFFVVYPYAPAGAIDPTTAIDNTFFDHYSVTKTIEDLFGLPYLAHAADPQTNSLIGHFGLQTTPVAPPPADTTPPTSPSPLTANSVSSTEVDLSWPASTDAVGVTSYAIMRDNAPLASTTSTSFNDTGLTANTTYSYSVQALDAANNGSTPATASATTQPAAIANVCSATPAGMTELSGNVNLEASQTGWTGFYNTTPTVVSRVQPIGGSFDGSWALQVAPKSGSSGTAGVNNASPIWVTNLLGGTTYTGSAMVKASFAGEKITLLVRETTPTSGSVSSHATTLTLNDTDWHPISSAYTARTTGNYIRYSLYASNFASSSQNFLADCLSLQAPSAN